MTARRAGRSDSRPGWPSTTCRAAMSSHGQSPARRRWGTVMASAVAAVPGRTWWTSKQASTADRQNGGIYWIYLYVPLLLSASTTTAKQIESKVLKLEDCHRNSCVNVPKLPFSTRVNIQTLHVSENASHSVPTWSTEHSLSLSRDTISLNELLSSVINAGARSNAPRRHAVRREELEVCVGFQQPALRETHNKCPHR